MYNYGKNLLSSIATSISNTLIPTSLSNTAEHQTEDSKRPANSKVSSSSSSHDNIENGSCSSSTVIRGNDTRTNMNITTTTTTATSTQTASPISQPQQETENMNDNTNGNSKGSRKRNRLEGNKTPMLVNPLFDSNSDNESCKTNKKQKISGVMGQPNSLLLQMIPTEVLQTHVFSFLTHARDYHSVQLSCTTFKTLSNKSEFLKRVHLSGEAETGNGSILRNVDSPIVAVELLYKFANVGNQQALYMIGMIAAYCHGDRIGVTILKQTARKGCLRSAYALGLILRDCNKTESEKYLTSAIEKGYLPACQELLSSQTVKDKFGELGAHTLKEFFDPIGLNRLLSRCYLHSNGVRGVATSHCWNPCCGRWALKATPSNDRRTPQLQCPSKCLPPLTSHIEASLIQLVHKDHKAGLKSNTAADTATGPVAIGSLSTSAGTSAGADTSSDSQSLDNEIMQLASTCENGRRSFRVSRMKMCSSCRRAKYCSKLCQVYDWRSGRHKMECQYL